MSCNPSPPKNDKHPGLRKTKPPIVATGGPLLFRPHRAADEIVVEVVDAHAGIDDDVLRVDAA